jgi:hypothetical protein
MKKIIASIICMLMFSNCFGGTQAGTVGQVFVRASDGLILFSLNGAAPTGSPACATHTYWLIADENSNSGKQQYAMLLAAQSSGKQVSVSGTNNCSRWGDGETADVIQILN